MSKLVKFIEVELDRNAWFFSKIEGSMEAACDFINFVIRDKEIMQLDEHDMKYIETITDCYSDIRYHTNEITKAIAKYKHAYNVLFADE